MSFSKLPVVCIQHIHNFNDTVDQFQFCSVNKFFINNIKITIIRNSQLKNEHIQKYIFNGRFKFNVHTLEMNYSNEYDNITIKTIAPSLKTLYWFRNQITMIKATLDILEELKLEKLILGQFTEIKEEHFKKISSNLKSLSITDTIYFTDRFFQNDNLQITALNISGNTKITNNAVAKLPLKVLALNDDKMITDDGLKYMNLEMLYLDGNKNITDKGIKHMSKLSTLSLRNNIKITNEGIKRMKNMSVLVLEYNNKITDEALQFMNLRYLFIGNSSITGKVLKYMTKLDSLSIMENANVYDNDIKHLVNMRSLIISGVTNRITNEGIKHMKNLTLLYCRYNKYITDKGIKHMNLCLFQPNDLITEDGIKHMKSLRELYTDATSKIPYNIKNYKRFENL
jgi:hypothetical protein